jgi:hypothetical protein
MKYVDEMMLINVRNCIANMRYVDDKMFCKCMSV